MAAQTNGVRARRKNKRLTRPITAETALENNRDPNPPDDYLAGGRPYFARPNIWIWRSPMRFAKDRRHCATASLANTLVVRS